MLTGRTLPRVGDVMAVTPRGVAAVPTPATILVVDDSESNRDTLLALLDTPDYRLTEAADGPAALRAATEIPPDLVLLDVMMPGMDGFEVCRRLRADPVLGEVPIVIVTALDDRQSRVSGLEAGADDFITKPFDAAELRARVRTITRLNRYRRLLESDARIREQAQWLDEASDAIYVCDAGGGIVYWNQGAARLFGWTTAEALGQHPARLLDGIPFRDVDADAGVTPAHEPEHRQHDVQCVTREGRAITVARRVTQLPNTAGERPGWLFIDTDVTDRKLAEHQLQRAQRLESIGTLAGGIAHDLNNALGPILMTTDLLRMDYPDRTELIDIIEASVQRGAAMVRQVLTFAKGVEGARLLLQPARLMTATEKIVRSTFPKNIRLETRGARDLRTIVGDPTQLDQVLLNLCVNARDAMPGGGTLTMEADNVDVDATLAGADGTPGRHVVWRITDTGTGIPADVLDRIFEPFFTTKGPDKGTGLGLSTTVGIVKNHGGFVRVESRLGLGSSFAVYLPAAESSVPIADVADRERSTVSFHGETILVVDDEPRLLDVFVRLLTPLNVKPITAQGGAEALARLSEIQAELHVVILDVHMPGIDGLAVARELRRLAPHAAILLCSGRLSDELADQFAALGVTARLDKPFTPSALTAALGALLGHR